MCGVGGIVTFDGSPVRKEDVSKLVTSINAGVNDQSNLLISKNVGFAHSMFWTTPESKFDRQPLVSEDGSLIMVADARIDNREELAGKLSGISLSHEMADSDLILTAYVKWSDRCVEHLCGDFTFVIYDKRTRSILIVRDHLGFRPLYYVHTGNIFAFCSEIHPLLNLGYVSSELDSEAFEYSLLFDAIPKQRTYFKNIFRCEGGTCTRVTEQGIVEQRYWYPENYEQRKYISFDDAIEEFLDIFRIAVNARLRSAYPIGLELSGGLDSSSVAMMVHQSDIVQDWHTFSLRFGDMGCDEGKYIDAVSHCIDRKPIELRVDQLDFSKYKLSDFYAQMRDWPADLFFIPHVLLAQKASNLGVRSLLTGQGGDEVMQGSRWMLYDFLRYHKFGSLAGYLKSSNDRRHDFFNYLLKPMLPGSVMDLLRELKYRVLGNISAAAYQKKYDMAKSLLFDDASFKLKASWDTARLLNNMESALWRDSNPYHHSSRNKIEVRHPFFDIRLVSFRLTSPASFFHSKNEYKVLLRNAMAEILPDSVQRRQDKAEFGEIIKMQLTAERRAPNPIESSLPFPISPDIWNARHMLHAKRGFDDHEGVLAWKLENIYNWINQCKL